MPYFAALSHFLLRDDADGTWAPLATPAGKEHITLAWRKTPFPNEAQRALEHAWNKAGIGIVVTGESMFGAKGDIAVYNVAFRTQEVKEHAQAFHAKFREEDEHGFNSAQLSPHINKWHLGAIVLPKGAELRATRASIREVGNPQPLYERVLLPL